MADMQEWSTQGLDEWTTAAVSGGGGGGGVLNITDPGQKVQLSLYRLLIPSLAAVVIILNLMVVISSGLIIKKGTQPRATYLFLGNVALSDLTTAIAILMGNLTPKQDRSHLTCAFSLGLIVSSTLVSIYSVGLIAVDRYLYIVHGLKYQQWVYPVRARLMIAHTWLLGCVVGFLPVMGWTGDTYNGRQCWFIRLLPPPLVMLTCVVGLLPILLVAVLYSVILYHALRKVVQLRRAVDSRHSQPPQHPQRPNQLRMFRGKQPQHAAPSKSKAIMVVVLTTGSFIITWVPYFVASFLYIYCDKAQNPDRCNGLEILIASPLAILGFLNSLLNPLIYAWWHNGFRASVRRLLCRERNPTTSAAAATPATTTTSATSVTTLPNYQIEMVNVDLN